MSSHVLRTVYVDLYVLASRLRSGGVGAARATEVRDWALERLKKARGHILAAGVDEQILNDAHLAVTGLLDEAAKSVGGEFAKQWDPQLQFEFFEHNDAGNKAFDRLEKLIDDPRKPVELLEVYAHCLALGFEGRYKVAKLDKLKQLREELNSQVQLRLGPLRWTQESDSSFSAPPSQKVLGPLPIAGLALSLLLLVGAGLFVGIKWQVHKAADEISKIGKVPSVKVPSVEDARGRREQGE